MPFNLKEKYPELAKVVAESEMVAEAYNLAKTAHIGQTRWGGEDYFETHVCEVANRVTMNGDGDAYFVCVALLHDVVEDTYITLDHLRQLFPTKIVEAVDAITHKPKDEDGNDTEQYADYIERVSKNSLARLVKFYDIKHNLYTLGDNRKNINRKRLYELALKYISLYEESKLTMVTLTHFV